ncbi:MAG: hypothetical protein QXD89_00715 [Candidatus Aenigmatarchaeota archaeon]
MVKLKDFLGKPFFITIVVIAFLSFSINLTSAEDENSSWIHTIGSWWLFFFLIGIAFIFGGLIFGKFSSTLRKWLSIIGLLIVFIGIFGVEVIYLIPFLSGQKADYFVRCEKLKESENIIEMITCIFLGYAPSGFEIATISVFIIFGVIAPLGILIALFYEVTRDIFHHQGVRNVIAFLSALISFRTLLSSMFFEVLNYGFAGLGIMLVDYLFFMIIFNTMKRTWIGAEVVKKIVDYTINYTIEGRIADLIKQIREIDALLAILDPDSEEYKKYEKRREKLVEELEKLKKESEKESKKGKLPPPSG